jgi:NAD(P)-dependent dehydrogenase (short-subunit alcohol dehydrogenase family)
MSTNSTILVTGGTSGLGYYATLELAKQYPDYQIITASRTDKDGATDSVNKATGHMNVKFLPLDLASLKNIRAFAADYASKGYPPIKCLLLNAGSTFPTGVGYTEDNIERTFAINHVGHGLLYFLLRPHLAKDCHVIITASGTHDPAQKTGVTDAKYSSAEELAHPRAESANYDGSQTYSTSKLCNVLWGYALHRRLTNHKPEGYDWSVACFDPGFMPGTGLARDASPVVRFLFSSVLPHLLPLLRLIIGANVHQPPESGAALAKLAVSTDVSGKYYEGAKAIKSSDASYDTEKQEDLWNWTLKAVAKDEAERREFEKVYPSS